MAASQRLLTDEQVRALRRMWRNERKPIRHIATLFEIGCTTAWLCAEGYTYRHVEDD